ncbi:MAG: transporter substrate-binding domain-containing protein [Ekhidna sp.]|nr:transporter substrate-binding domain-containing protein [Ekhidna sp.]
MRTFTTTILILFVINSSFAQAFKGDTWAQAQSNKRATVVLTNVQSAVFADSQSQSGICFDIMDDFADFVKVKYGVTINYDYRQVADPSNFQSFLSTVENSEGGVFGLGDITITNDRKNRFDFSPPFFSNVAVLITKSSVPLLSSLSEIPTNFKRMLAVSQGGTTHDKRIQELSAKYGNFQIVYAASAADKTILVKSSARYFTYLDLPNYLELKSSGADIKRHPVGDIKGEYYGMILPKGSDWTPIIAEFFRTNDGYMKSQNYEGVLKENMGAEVVQLMRSVASR